MSERKHLLRWFSAWNDDREERWLEQMAQSGWRLVSGPILYCFEKDAPAQIRYRLDYRSENKGLDEYLKLCRDAGWEHVLSFAGWLYFRTSSPDAPEIYTDSSSRIAKYQRLLAISVAFAIITLGGNAHTLLSPPSTLHAGPFWAGFRWFVAGLCLLWVYILARLVFFIRSLKRRAASYRR